MPTQQQINALTEAFHRTAIQRPAAEPALVEQALQTLQRWQEQRGPSAPDPYLQQGKVLLKGNLAELQNRVCADNDAAATLRNASPLGFVLTPVERRAQEATA